jgi:dihydrofolate reductase
MITIIAAAGLDNSLGKDNKIIWHLPDDFKRFKQITSGHFIIMGRKTFESFPKPLPNRTHIIITRNNNYNAPDGCIIVNSIEKAIEVCPKEEPIFIIGGADIYKQSIDMANCIELTRINGHFEADAFFPKINLDLWKLETSQYHDKDEKHDYSFSFETYKRK